jgi:adenylate kinase
MKLILLGAAGSGKGTLAKKITRDFGIPQLSMGDMLRDIASSGSELGKKIGEYQNKGILVPSDVVFEVLKERLSQKDCENGYILDGFPRTIDQAHLLAKVTEVDAVISVELAFDEIERRLAARRTCPKCGEIDNANYEGFTGNCRKCQTPMFQRDDDKPEAIRTRLEVYKQNITPLINFYSDRLFKVSSAGSPDETYKPVYDFLKTLEA